MEREARLLWLTLLGVVLTSGLFLYPYLVDEPGNDSDRELETYGRLDAPAAQTASGFQTPRLARRRNVSVLRVAHRGEAKGLFIAPTDQLDRRLPSGWYPVIEFMSRPELRGSADDYFATAAAHTGAILELQSQLIASDFFARHAITNNGLDGRAAIRGAVARWREFLVVIRIVGETHDFMVTDGLRTVTLRSVHRRGCDIPQELIGSRGSTTGRRSLRFTCYLEGEREARPSEYYCHGEGLTLRHCSSADFSRAYERSLPCTRLRGFFELGFLIRSLHSLNPPPMTDH